MFQEEKDVKLTIVSHPQQPQQIYSERGESVVFFGKP